MTWLLNTIYGCLLLLVSPVVVWRSVRHGRYRRGLSEKLLGRLPVSDSVRPVVWFHAVSVGEVLQLEHVLSEFRAATGDRYRILLTTSTDSGFDVAQQRYADCNISWFPLDFSWAVNAALDRVRPELVVLAELEFWPGFLKACRQRNIRTAVMNARMSDRSFRGYQYLGRLIRRELSHFSVVAAQSQEYADRLITLGTRPECTHVTGSVKFDGLWADRDNPDTENLRQLFDVVSGQTILIAGSTQDPEELMAIEAWQQARQSHSGLRLILVPRHRERFDEVAQLLSERGIDCVRRSTLKPGTRVVADQVVLLDTIGELKACWGLADLAFVGGSFGSRNGQNMLEPAAYGAAVVVGPRTSNFREAMKHLRSREAVEELQVPADFPGVLITLLESASRRHRMGRDAQCFVREQRGAVARTVQLLSDVLPLSQSSSSRSAA